MRPYKFRMRLSSKRLNVTRLGKGPAAACRAAAWLSLGSASSDIELMESLLSCFLHHFANRARLQEGRSAGWPEFARDGSSRTPLRAETCRHAIVSGIIIPPHFRLPTA